MKSLVLASQSGEIPAESTLIIAPNQSSPSIQTAESIGVQAIILNPNSATYSEELLHALITNSIDFICLAGFLRLVPGQIIQVFPNRILNIHPALLPNFGGKGMYGAKVHAAVAEALSAGLVKESGCTVHRVNEHYDDGAIIAQSKCDLKPGMDSQDIEKAVRDLEPSTYIRAINLMLTQEGLI